MAEAVDFRQWDWLPKAASEFEIYLERLLKEGSITAHDITARSKSITSFEEKCRRKDYQDPVIQVTDSVAARLITYSVTDRDRIRHLIRGRFEVIEDCIPAKSKELRGYECIHMVIKGELPDSPTGWLINDGELSRYFEQFGGLEIQIRTVAAHAWAEFEHHSRYKGEEYAALGQRDRDTIDLLFGAAADARNSLDQTFVAIEHLLANPSDVSAPSPASPVKSRASSTLAPIDEAVLGDYLRGRFPEDGDGSPDGLTFACEVLRACEIESIEALDRALGDVDGDQVRKLIDTLQVTRVRRLDDELLELFGEDYIDRTKDLGSAPWVSNRKQNLESRFDKLRRKVKVYELSGLDCPAGLDAVRISASRGVREIAAIVANRFGTDRIAIDGFLSVNDDLRVSTRSLALELKDGSFIWIATNLNRATSEWIMQELIGNHEGLDLQVTKSGRPLASAYQDDAEESA